MPAYRAIAASVVAHAALLAAIAHAIDQLEPPPPYEHDAPVSIEVVPPTPVEIVPTAPAVEVLPIDVALLDEIAPTIPPPPTTPPSSPPAATISPPPSTTSTATTSPPSSTTSTAPAIAANQTRGATGTSGSAAPPGEPASALGMRGRRHDLTLSGDALARIAPGGPPELPAFTSGHIKAAGRESKIDDAVASYTVHADGTIDLHHKPHIDLHFNLPIPTPGQLKRALRDWGEDIAAWTEDPYRDTKVGTWQDLPKEMQAIPGACNSYGDISCTAGLAGGMMPAGTPGNDGGVSIFGIISGRLDLVGWLHEKYIGDPYASRKLKMLDETRPERVRAGTQYRAEQLNRSAELTLRNLDALSRLDPAARRQAAFELWDECLEGEGPAGAAGARARAMVIGWIRSHLPASSGDAYSVADLARLNAQRKSSSVFAPYD